ncbi:MAG: type I DNA topoisomerase [Pseudomonadota bacterium]
MAKNLLIVESPAKSRTIKKYLGSDFEVLASYGHVRDLRPKEGAVEPDHGFAMHYELIERNTKHVGAIVKAMRKAKSLYLATDPDREGEAIAWHLVEILEDKGVLKDKEVHRVVFHEITKKAITEAVEHSRELATELINAQQARRALDYLVGFNLSPLLWRKVRRGLSAGRVQSPALRMIVERELEIEAFKPREYWTLEADLAHEDQSFVARLYKFQGERVEQFSFENERDAFAAQAALKVHGVSGLDVLSVEKKQRRRNPAPPFTTSTLQQEASRKLGFSAQKTMRVAQQLYEGVEAAEALGGLITYMRTDSVNLAAEAVNDIREYVGQKHPDVGVPKEPRTFKTKSKNAQEAHEAIRPTDINRTPDSLKAPLDGDQAKLYELIWKRTLACQMAHALIDTVSIDFACGDDNVFRATGSTIAKPGFMVVYEESVDAAKANEEDRRLPRLEEGDRVGLSDIRADQHFTEPPPRYSEATLVKSLEEHGIGRPSTYAAIISTLQQREYVTLEKRRFFPTDVGRVVSRFLTEHFDRYVDYGFTANLEDDLDAISRGEKEWVPVMESFWDAFKSRIDLKHETVKRSDVTQEKMDEACPDCGQPLAIRLGRRGRFVGCTAFPECKYTRSLESANEEERAQMQAVEGRTCPKCSSPLIVREGKYGKFIGCSGYPDCSHIEALDPPVDTGFKCPVCENGAIMRRKSRRGKVFYSCSGYPKCDYALWNEPVEGPCPNCEWPILSVKTTKRRGTERVCPQRCGFSEPVEEAVAEEMPEVS